MKSRSGGSVKGRIRREGDESDKQRKDLDRWRTIRTERRLGSKGQVARAGQDERKKKREHEGANGEDRR